MDKLANRFDDFQYKPVGIGNKSGTIGFYYPIYNGKTMTVLESCDRAKAKSWLNSDTVYFFDENKLVPREKTSLIKPYLAVSQSQALEAAG